MECGLSVAVSLRYTSARCNCAVGWVKWAAGFYCEVDSIAVIGARNGKLKIP
jgi:hypothetical protein